MSAKDETDRSGFMRAIAAPIGKWTKSAIGKRGFAESAVLSEWPSIIGSHLARFTCPMKIVYRKGERGDGTLHLRVSSAAMATEIQHLTPLILERINGFFGYRAVAKLTLMHGPLPKPPTPKPLRSALSPEAKQNLEHSLKEIEDPDLKAALEKLGEGILSRIKK